MKPKHVEFVVIHLIYIRSQQKHLMMTRKRSRPSGTVSQVSDWYFRTLSLERSELEPDTRVRYKEWRIFSGNEDLFTVNERRYDQIYIFLGIEASHWVFFKKDPTQGRLEGTGFLKMSYCGCCIFSQYQRILGIIKSRLELE